MLVFWTFVVAALLGYVIGHYVKPNHRLQKEIKKAREICMAALEQGNKGVYRTLVTEQNKSSELVIEVKELAVTQGGQVKVEYLEAYYKNPEFRTRKGEALLKEVRELLGDYLPLNDIEWYETTERHDNIKKHLNTLDNLRNHQPEE
ncbi:hypothetical protein DXT99_01900 [Pontibacter diazotrophicus]|uniref:Uncharacterized protein n=1 Tax=Pontibacter diazotrophicus TaxID=1400979 RepID=A0A3D8LHR8_9BACT|nr:hypothetical protein [Pontibacter diazotrophicus]RDV16888.1 hypothetical protein DXT99_01900 [Pontibacter diazotrophicus]